MMPHNPPPRRHPGRVLATGQPPPPFAAVVCCSDCGPAPEVVLGQPPGSLITVQNPGLLATDGVVASVDAAVAFERAGLVIVLAHDDCPLIGQIAARPPSELHPYLRDNFRECRDTGAISGSPPGPPGVLTARMALENAHAQARAILARSEAVRAAVAGGRVEFRVALFNSATGSVSSWPLR